MKTFIVIVQKEHGANANPVNHRQKFVTCQIDKEEAGNAVARLAAGRKVIDVVEVIPYSSMCIVA